MKKEQFEIVGRGVPRKDAIEKITGGALYINDLRFKDMLYGGVVSSPHPHALIKAIHTEEAEKMPGVICVLTHSHINGANQVTAIIPDEPVLCKDRVLRIGDPVALVAAKTPEQLKAAMKCIRVDYEELEGVFTPERAIEHDAPILHPEKVDNILLKKTINVGNVDEAFSNCDVIVENKYFSPRLSHMYLEPEGAIARYENGTMTVYCCLQHAHGCRDLIASVMGIPMNKVRLLIQTVGGGFGGKEDFTLPCHAALLAHYSQKTVKMIRSREESTILGTKRHPFWIRAKTGAKKDGTILAHEAHMLADAGPYCNSSPVVATRAIMHFMGPYNIPNIRGECLMLYTNNPISGSFRGFGAPQAAICYEGQMSAIAKALGIDPLELRIRHAHREGSVTATGQQLYESVGLMETIQQAKKKAYEVMDNKAMERRWGKP